MADTAKKGSQLKQLKHSLKQSGLSRAATTSATTNSRSRKKKSSISTHLSHPDFRQRKLAEIQASQNLFDVKTSKVKFPTANQSQRQTARLGGPQKSKIIKTVGKPTQSATQAHQTRVEKLLPEYLNRHKSSQFLDKRFGEADSNLTPEEKALERFTKERQDRSSRARKRNVFNLDDEGEGLYDDGQFGDNITLTHGGRHLNLDDDAQDDDCEDPESIFKKRQDPGHSHDHDSHRGLEDHDDDDNDQPTRKKSKAEVMSEIITKSKAHKYQRQMIKEKDDQLRDELNEELREIRSLLFSSAPPRTKQSGSTNEQPASTNVVLTLHPKVSPTEQTTEPDATTQDTKADPTPSKVEASSAPQIDRALLDALIGGDASSDGENEQEDAYDRFVRELAFDTRAKPSDRMKTEEEAALEEAERLRELELERLKRMRGEDDDDNDNEATRSGKKSKQNQKRRKPEADDLENDFFPYEEPSSTQPDLETGLRPDGAFGAGVVNEEDQEGSEEDSEASQGSNSDEEDDEDSSDSLGDHGVSEDGLKKIEPLVSKELAYTYPCPASASEFLSILSSNSIDSSDLPMVVQRIRVLYHPSLGEGNKEKLATFTNVLIDHLIYLSSKPLPDGTSLADLLNGLLPHLVHLCKSYSQTSASHFVSKLVVMHKNLNHALTHPNINGWPGASELLLLRLVGLVWSTSDFSHPVAAPALLLINQYLNQLRVNQFSDLLSGLFLCTLVLQYETHSRRFVPEVINFLMLTILRMAFTIEEIERAKGMTPVIEGSQLVLFPVNDKEEMRTLQPKTMNFTSIFNSYKASPNDQVSDQDLVNTFDVTLSLLGNFSELYGSLSVYPEIFSSVLDVLSSIDLSRTITPASQVRIRELIGTIKSKKEKRNRERKLNPIQLQSHKPIPIKSQQPHFELDFNPNTKKFNPDSAQVEINKLKNLIKKEKKGAIRELRKDNKFLAITKAKEKDEIDLQYKSKIAKITASLQEERSEEKKTDRLKSRLKKLDKAKRKN